MLNEEEEASLVEHLLTLAKWGFLFDTSDLKHMVKGYLGRLGRQVPIFKENMPAQDWASSLLKRHENAIGKRMCQNIKPTRVNISAEDINSFFDHLANTLTDSDGSPIPPTNISNYDKSNLTDDPGLKKCIFRRGVKYPERVMASTKSATSIMFCGHRPPPAVLRGVQIRAYMVYLDVEWPT